ncbi:thioredoxin domain-containing protein 12-like, partial [Xenia sp. Carnegie-2017]|uniref:thioredoxin domain-containing protein 12-like n=1 Tax=Xenia sp. Carnegie-2017 TaxID=2897299 RepID=UPI001F04B9BD
MTFNNTQVFLVFINIFLTITQVTGEILSKGFGSNIDWKSLDETVMHISKKPKMLIIHKSWCKACVGLKEQFLSSDEIEELSREFVMINTNDEIASQKEEYDIDGKYVPRIFFYGKNGKILKNIMNEKREKYQYFYSKAEDVIKSMKTVIEQEKNISLDRGYNKNINWTTMANAEVESRKSGKPIMVLIHKSWCSSCKILKPQFAASKEIEELSKNFVMVNTEDDEEPKDKAYAVDGAYIPRIYFVEPSGKVMDHIWNKGTS